MPLYFLLMVLVVLLDQALKFFIVTNISLNTSFSLVNGLLSLAYVRNYGAAWSMLIGQRLFFTVISVGALGFFAYYFKKKYPAKLYSFAFALLIGGTLGNFLDRLRLGYVVDMFQLDFINFPIFNIADTALTIGVILLMLALLLDKDE